MKMSVPPISDRGSRGRIIEIIDNSVTNENDNEILKGDTKPLRRFKKILNVLLTLYDFKFKTTNKGATIDSIEDFGSKSFSTKPMKVIRFKSIGSIKKSIKRRSLRYLLQDFPSLIHITLVVIVIVRFMYLSYLNMREDQFWKQAASRPSGNLSQCEMFNHYNTDSEMIEQYLEARQKLLDYGGQFYLNPSTVLGYSFVPIISICYWLLTALYLSASGITLDFLNFVLEPDNTRKTMRAELLKVIISLARSIRDSDRHAMKLVELNDKFSSRHNSIFTQKEQQQENNKSGQRLQSFNDQSSEVIYALRDIIKSNLVRPSNITVDWHKKLWSIITNLFKRSTFFSITIPIILVLVSISGHAHEDLKIMIQYEHCKDLSGYNRTSYPSILACRRLSDPVTLNMLKSLSLDDDFNLYGLSVIYHVRDCISLGNIWHLIEYTLVYIYFSFFTCLLMTAFVLGYYDKSRWLKQIENQVENCCREIDNIEYMDRNLELNNDKFKKKSTQESVVKNIMVAYLNYALFRRQHWRFKRFNEFVSFESGIAVIAYLTCSYFAGYYALNSLNLALTICVAACVVTINIFWLVPSRFLNKIVKFRRSITQLVAKGQSSKIDLRIPIDLWRNQMVEESELNSLFAQKSLVGYMTYNRMISLNGYMMAAWIILFKPE